MDTLEWTLWPARWAILLIGLLTQLAALALAMRQRRAQARSTPSSPRARLPENTPLSNSGPGKDSTSATSADIASPSVGHGATPGEYPGKTPHPTAQTVRPVGTVRSFRITRGLLVTGGTLVAAFALLERDMLLLAGQTLALPLLWPRLR